jgi:sarcosine oxidase subunit alpha
MSSAGPYRLSRGGQIDRSRLLSFLFNGRLYTGCSGDSVASALLANGIRTVARSFKFHRPRGIFACGLEEPNALLTLSSGADAIPSVRAPVVELTAGLQAHSQAGWPSVNFDIGRVLDVAAPLWAAGFYNKTFIWPSWHPYEGIIRRLAGLGRAPSGRDRDHYDIANSHCDVLIIGGGIAGLGEALEAGRAGARVILADQDSVLGGQSAWDGSMAGTASSAEWLAVVIKLLEAMRDVQILRRTTAVGCYDHNVVTLLERVGQPDRNSPRERYRIVRAKRVVLATGAIEQPLIFSHNDRPGIMLAGSARQYVRRYGVAPGSRVLIATNNDSAYAAAWDLKEAGVTILSVTDSRKAVPAPHREAMKSLGIPLLTGWLPIDSDGFNGLSRVTVGQLSSDAQSVSSTERIACDALLVSGGWNPALHLFAQAGGKLAYDELSGALHPNVGIGSMLIVGRAAERVTVGPRVSPVGRTGRQWIDLLHDVTVADIELALRERFMSVEHVKRFTTVGMAADQGKTSTAASLEVIAKLRRISPAELGHTTMRPPLIPVTLGAIAGRDVRAHFAPMRFLPAHDWHLTHGARMQDFGGWQRPVAYLNEGETRERATQREAIAVRTRAGLFDGSPLGKIEVRGPDALEFLDRVYLNNLKTLKPGQIRYGLMLRETGVIFDDGTIAALAPDRVLVTTTSTNASRVTAWLEEWHQCEWPNLRVAVAAVTEQWATLSLAGPKARSILAKMGAQIDLSRAAFPHLALRECRLSGVPARICRVSFTGELTYEINVPAGAAPGLWATLMRIGEPEGLQAFGMDALLLMRLEKGFLHIGSDTDGTTVPDDIGWGEVACNKTRDYVGKRSLSLPENVRPDRLQLVGLKPMASSANTGFVIGSHLRTDRSSNPTDGWITSAGRTVLTREPIALALLAGGRQRIDSEVVVYDAGVSVMRAQVVNLPFFDSTGERMHA